LSPGGLLRPAVLASAFATSRVPAEMALHRLAARGLVAREEGHGWRVVGGRGSSTGRLVDTAPLASTEAERAALRQRNWRDRIYAEIEEQVSGCLLLGRFQISSQALAAQYGFSRTVAQECITLLERVGIVRQESNGRWSAGPLDKRRIEELFELRRILEPIALGQSTLIGDRVLLGHMRERVHEAE